MTRLERDVELARTGLPHTRRTEAAVDRGGDRDATAADLARPQLPASDHTGRRQRQPGAA